ncbi:bisanhydrobacterioruberin hydratase [Halocatena pleomorpha]|uniref:Carotenoid biosynthesis protein n=1 Tax=Halocatena pleomorpha TaxID=1785090 RepID=A0A3P3RMV3_9EURY|nr:bisanhydrobacterioruberin hydratase [Halocatena pleomorpha]RRJ34210.1 carotenoid biosynthesis protein [Halocatena pleomorpha]
MAEASVTLNRQRVERAFDSMVRENRALFGVVVPTVGAVMLLASFESVLPVLLPFDSSLILIGVVAMRLPLIAGLLPLIDRKAATALILLTVYAYGIEYVGITTGVPYGQFSYDVGLEPLLFGEVPLGLPIFFIPIVANCCLLLLLLLDGRFGRTLILSSIIAVIGMDLVLDPAAVALGFWSYSGGLYHGVPVSNYLGWTVSATIAVVIFNWGFEQSAVLNRLHQCEFMLDSLTAFIIFWGAVNAYFGYLLPVGITGLFALGLVTADRVILPFDPSL